MSFVRKQVLIFMNSSLKHCKKSLRIINISRVASHMGTMNLKHNSHNVEGEHIQSLSLKNIINQNFSNYKSYQYTINKKI